MNRYLSILLFVVIFIFTPAFVDTIIAQPPPPDPVEIPIDGGLGILLAAGISYAARKIYKDRKAEM